MVKVAQYFSLSFFVLVGSILFADRIEAKVTFKETEIPVLFQKAIKASIKKILKEFTSSSRKIKEQVLNILTAAFIDYEYLEKVNEKEKELFEKSMSSFMGSLSPETNALQKLITDTFEKIMSKELEKGNESFFKSCSNESDFQKLITSIGTAYQLIVYEELYMSLNADEKKSFQHFFNIKKLTATGKNSLPQPEELYEFFPKTVSFILQMQEFFKSMQQDNNSAAQEE